MCVMFAILSCLGSQAIKMWFRCFCGLVMSEDGVGCKDCKRVREHVASLLPFKIVEAMAGKPLRIGGITMAAGMSRNFNVYTPDELAVFAEKLVNAPVYIEHVSVETATGKVTKVATQIQLQKQRNRKNRKFQRLKRIVIPSI